MRPFYDHDVSEQFQLREPQEIAQLFNGTTLIPPGVVTAADWNPNAAIPAAGREEDEFAAMIAGLGAGFFWDAVQAIGGRRLTPLQGVAALGEAIDVIRGVWDVDGPGTLHVDGEFYQVHGAERGPAPTHEIPIWLGAHKPRMQDPVGRKSDGWLPSLPVIEPGGLSKGTQ